MLTTTCGTVPKVDIGFLSLWRMLPPGTMFAPVSTSSVEPGIAQTGRSSYSLLGRWRPFALGRAKDAFIRRSEEHTSELQSLMRLSYAVFCLKQNNNT